MKKAEAIAIIGYGVEGKSMINYLLNNNYYNLTVLDQNHIQLEIEHSIKGVKTFCGGDYLKFLNNYKTIFRSPGIYPLFPEIIKAKENGAKINSVTNFFLNNNNSFTIGVTGTKGKGTTSKLIDLMLNNAGHSTYLGGNIGIAATDFLHQLHKDDLIVLELSSYQLMDLDKSPNIAVMLKTTEDHLDFHKDRSEYVNAKLNIFKKQKQQDISISYIDGKNLENKENLLNLDTKGHKYFYSPSLNFQNHKNINGCYIRDKKIIFKKANEETEIYNLNNLGLIGEHNYENALAATLIALIMEIPHQYIQETLSNFKGLPNRLEKVAELNGITYINDSFSTNPQTCIAAINSFTSPIHLFLGGSEKNADFSELIETIKKKTNLKEIYLMGDIKERFSLEFNKQEIHPILVNTLEEAFQLAQKSSKEGDMFLLSPACASFGLFKNYKERAEVFKKLVKNLIK